MMKKRKAIQRDEDNALKKKGFELSINFIVTIILILVIFTSSVYLVNKFFSEAMSLHAQLDQQTKEKIWELLNEREIVVLPDSDRPAAQINQNQIFALGIWNIQPKSSDIQFTVNLTFDKGFTKDGDPINSCQNGVGCASCFQQYYFQNWVVKNTEKVADSLLIKPLPNCVLSGTYTFNVAVCPYQDIGDGICDGFADLDGKTPHGSEKSELYDGRIHKITITIP